MSVIKINQEAVREVEFEDAAIEKLLEEHARAHEEQVDDEILPIHPVAKLHNDEIAPVEVINYRSSSGQQEQHNTTWVFTLFTLFAVFLLVATFKQWRRALLRLLLRCGDSPNETSRPNYSQYQRLAEHQYQSTSSSTSHRRETFI